MVRRKITKPVKAERKDPEDFETDLDYMGEDSKE
jgi:hypothetical protein